MKLSQLLSCTPFLLPPTRHRAQLPLAAHLRQVGTQAMPTSPSRPVAEPAPNRMSTFVRRTPQAQREHATLDQARQRTADWVREQPLQDRQDLLRSQLTSLVHQFIDAGMEGVLRRGGDRKAYRAAILHAARRLPGLKSYVRNDGGPGLLACQLRNFCTRAKLDVSSKNPALEQASERAIRSLTATLAQELGVATPSELRLALTRAEQAYLGTLDATASAPPARVRHSLGRVDSIRLARWR